MKCPFCGSGDNKVIDSRPNDERASIRRWRECIECSKRFTTYETIENTPMYVVKKDGARQMFDRNKIVGGLVRACQKRPVPLATLENLAAEIEQTLQNEMEREVPSARISDMVTARLRSIDEVAYVRFASVTRHFADVETFIAEINTLLRDKEFTGQTRP